MARVKKDIAIIGAGVVGTAIGKLALKAGYRIAAVASRTEASAKKAVGILRCEPDVIRPAEQAASLGQIVLLTVPDDAIAPLAKQLGQAKALQRGATVAHCSGALGSEVLLGLAGRCGASAASMHPLQTFPNVKAAIWTLRGAYCFCEGQHRAVSDVMQLATDIGCVPVEIDPDRKVLYHASACMACNYLATMQEAAIATALLAGVDRRLARRALAPLVAATAKNVNKLGPGGALTGPIARGDAKTVSRHLHALRRVDAKLAELYRQLGLRTVELAQSVGKIDETTAGKLAAVLKDA